MTKLFLLGLLGAGSPLFLRVLASLIKLLPWLKLFGSPQTGGGWAAGKTTGSCHYRQGRGGDHRHTADGHLRHHFAWDNNTFVETG